MENKTLDKEKRMHKNNIWSSLICMILVLTVGCSKEQWEGPELENQQLGMKTISNARQLAGYPAAGGKQVKDSVLLRSGMLFDASDEDIEKLKEEYGLRVIIDLRTTIEATEKPDPIIDGVVYYHLPLMDEDVGTANYVAIVEIYRQYGNDPGRAYLEMIRAGALSEGMYTDFFDSEEALKVWRQLFDVLLQQEDGAVLWHCTGGKDRAGLTTAIVLSLLGVDEETILADFTLTNEVLSKQIDYITKEAGKYTSDKEELEKVAALVGVSEDHMRMAFACAREECGSMAAFIQQKIGLTDEEVQLLQKKYLE